MSPASPSRPSSKSAVWVLLPSRKPFKTKTLMQSTSVCWGGKKKHSASSHTMKNMLKDLNHSPTYQHRKETELFPVSFVISLLWTIWGHSPKKGAEVLFTCCTWQPSALSLITGQTSRAHRCCCVLLGRAFNPNWRSQLGQKNTRKPTQQPN